MGRPPGYDPALLRPAEQFFHIPLPPESVYDPAGAPDMAIRAQHAPAQAGALQYKSAEAESDPDKFWIDHGKETYNRFKARWKVSKAVQAKAAEITAKAKTGEEKVLLLVDFCKTAIKNSQTEAVSAEERLEADKNKIPEDTLVQGIGTVEDIRFLFVALATAGIRCPPRRIALPAERAFRSAFHGPVFSHRARSGC